MVYIYYYFQGILSKKKKRHSEFELQTRNNYKLQLLTVFL